MTFTETLRQFTSRRTREIATEYDLTQVEVRELYDWPYLWWQAVRTAAIDGQVIHKRIFQALDPIHQYHLAHDYPESVPPGVTLVA